MDLIGLYSNPDLATAWPARRTETSPDDQAVNVDRRRKQRQKRLTPAEIDALVGDRCGGMTIMALSNRYGIHRTTVMNHLKRSMHRIDAMTYVLAREEASGPHHAFDSEAKGVLCGTPGNYTVYADKTFSPEHPFASGRYSEMVSDQASS